FQLGGMFVLLQERPQLILLIIVKRPMTIAMTLLLVPAQDYIGDVLVLAPVQF
ncbi:unnamed protein product, partial [marine sediment metagenome]